MVIDTTSPLPLYAQVEDALWDEVRSGRLNPGDQIPSEDTLVEQYKVSRTTIRSAIQQLVSRQILEIRRGRGTFVSEKRITQNLTELTGFIEDMNLLGLKPSAKVLDKTIVLADEVVAQQLNIAIGANVVKIHRVRIGDGTPISFDETFLPLEIGTQIIKEDNLVLEPIFSLLEQKYRFTLKYANYKLGAVLAEAHISKALKIATGDPIFLIERTIYTADDRPIDFERLHYRGDMIRFETRLLRSRV